LAVPGGTSATPATGTKSSDTTAQVRADEEDALLDTYRSWLVAERKLLGNASHHAYAFGQANMAERAIVEFDKTLASGVYLTLAESEARAALAALDAAVAREPALAALRDALRGALDALPPKR
jgi:hypothetical protein